MQNTNTVHPMVQCSDLIKRIYNKMGNEYSKKMYTNRLLYNMTGDVIYLQNVIEMTKEGALFLTQLRNAQNAGKKIFIFGTGVWGKLIAQKYNNFSFCAFIDNNVKEKIVENLPVLSFAEYMQQKDNSVVIIATRFYFEEIYQQLKENNIEDNCIINLGKLEEELFSLQYFDLKELRNKEKEHEIFVDCGCYDGLSSEQFASWHGNKTGTIYAFEPDAKNRVLCEERFEKMQKIGGGGYNSFVFPVGVWDSKTVLHFKSGAGVASRVADDGDIEIAVDSLDNVLKNKEVSFIKMDIEGSEYQALIGASNLIKKYKPKLAISIYHKLEDIWTLPEIILQLNPDYTFYLSHYTLANTDTVLYAI